MPRSLPPLARPYKQTRIFTQDDMPQGLRNNHATKDGVWALVHVVEGCLIYHVTDPASVSESFELTPQSAPGLILPGELHHVEPQGAVRFYVEFHAVPEAGAGDVAVEHGADPASVHQ